MPLYETPSYLKQLTYPVVQLERPFMDSRGGIQNLTTHGARSVAVIRSAAGSQRANHVHKTDEHLTYVVSGRVEYIWQDVLVKGGEVVSRVGELKRVVVEEGQAFHTPPHVAHVMHFLEDSVIVTLAPNSRDHESHEADLIRVPSLVDEYNKRAFGA